VISRIPARVTDVIPAIVIFLQPSPYLLPTHNAHTAIMGIKHLFQLIQEHAPAAIKTGEIKNQFGRKVAIVCIPYPL
jgi:hypothetical protein